MTTLADHHRQDLIDMAIFEPDPSAGPCPNGPSVTGASLSTEPVAARARQRAGVPAPALGPGWFESSWELQRGLLVHEDAAWTEPPAPP